MNKFYLLLLTVCCILPLQAKTIYVTESGTGDGTSWADAFGPDDLQTAINSASPGDEVWVARGRYVGGFTIKEGVNVYGSFDGTESDKPDYKFLYETQRLSTYLDGDNGVRVLTQENDFVNQPTIWCGFHITNGNASNDNSTANTKRGGGALIMQGMTLSHCMIESNIAADNFDGSSFGGGVYNSGTIEYCYILNNKAGKFTENNQLLKPFPAGGGIYNDATGKVLNCQITGNTANSGTGYQTGIGMGGGIYNRGYVENCLITHNTANDATTIASLGEEGSGGGVYNSADAKLIGCLIINNTALLNGTYAVGGGAYNVGIIINCSVADNYSLQSADANTNVYAGGVYNIGKAKLYNSIVWTNYNRPDESADVYVTMQNGDVPEMAYSIFSEASSGDGWNNTNADPLLSSYKLSANSPAVNKGNNAYFTNASANTKDIDGNNRIVDSKIDLGAYEYQVSIPTPTPTNKRLYVNAAGNGQTANGSNWNSALASLKTALDFAAANPGEVTEIWVAEGEYKGAFNIVEGVNVYGSFNGDETERPEKPDTLNNKTILNGQNQNRVLTQSKHFTTQTVWSGFQITGGNATNASVDAGNGGGAYIMQGTTLEYCNIYGNTAYTGTDAAYYFGGGVYSYKGNITRSKIYDNVTYRGSSADITGKGGGVDIAEGSISYSVISGNTAYKGMGNTDGMGYGGGIAANNAIIHNCLIDNNIAYTNDTPTSGKGYGGGIDIEEGCKVNSCTVTANSAVKNATNGSVAGGGGICVHDDTNEIYNSIIWNNSDTQQGREDLFDYFGQGDFTIKYSIWNNANENDGNNNSKADPKLAANYRLTEQSPAIDTGSNIIYSDISTINIGIDFDLDGNDRLQGEVIDIGAFEHEEVTPSIVPSADNKLYINFKANGTVTNGSSWENAMTSIQEALDYAKRNSNAVKEIVIGRGEYVIKDSALVIGSSIQVTGGYLGTKTKAEASDSLGTVLKPAGNWRAVIIAGSGSANIIEPKLSNVIITGGKASTTSIRANGVVITRNNGGGVYSVNANPTLTNVVITGNSADKGGGMYIKNGKVSLINTTFSANAAAKEGGAIYNESNDTKLVNSIVWGNTTSDKEKSILNDDATPSYINTLVEDVDLTKVGKGNLNGTNGWNNPMFTAEGKHPFSLKASSPLINKGTKDTLFTATDVDVAGNLRLKDSVDLGAYEFQNAFPLRMVFPDTALIDSLKGFIVDTKLYGKSSDTTYYVAYDTDFSFKLDLEKEADSVLYLVTGGKDTVVPVKGVYTFKKVKTDMTLELDTNIIYVTIPKIKGLLTSPEAGKHLVSFGDSLELKFRLEDGYEEFDLHLVLNGDTVSNLTNIESGESTHATFEFGSNTSTKSVHLRSNEIYSFWIKNITRSVVVALKGVIDDMPVAKEKDPVISNGIKIYTNDSRLFVDVDTPCQLSVYTLTGRLHTQRQIPVGTTIIQLGKGIYIVRAGTVIQKVLVK